MLDLTFGEQVKIVLSRKGMTIKELAEMIEAQTGKKMSRQNLTQRLGRDNFQEQDMRMIAQILGCPFHLNILNEEESTEENDNDIEEVQVPKKKKKVAKAPVVEEPVVEEELVAEEEPAVAEEPEVVEEPVAEEAPVYYEEESIAEEVPVYYEEEPVAEETPAYYEEAPVYYEEEPVVEEAPVYYEEESAVEEEPVAEQPVKEEPVKESEKKAPEKKETGWFSSFRRRMKKEDKKAQEKTPEVAKVEETPAEPEADEEVQQLGYSESVSKEEFPDSGAYIDELVQEAHEQEYDWYPQAEEAYREELEAAPVDEEDLEHGDINPYTGREYETNSVRVHPTKIGYVQVYDRAQHAWSDMTEWAFLGYQEQKKALLGKDYEPPIYLD